MATETLTKPKSTFAEIVSSLDPSRDEDHLPPFWD